MSDYWIGVALPFLWCVYEEVVSSSVALVSCLYQVDSCIGYSFGNLACVLLSDVYPSAPRVTGASYADKEVKSNVTTKLVDL